MCGVRSWEVKVKIFVAHPYNDEMSDFRAAFSEVEKQFTGVKFIYADMEITSEFVLTKIEGMIATADFSLFDISGWNPNVTLELGIALGQKRTHYILFKPKTSGEEVPSDIKGKERIQYKSLVELKGKIAIVVQKQLDLVGPSVSSAYDDIRNGALSLIERSGPISVADISDSMKIDQSVVRSIVYGLKDEGTIVMNGNKKGAKYSLKAAQ
jgi:hypothetical protein